MFYVFNKDKIISGLTVLVSVLMLFLLANILKPNLNWVETSAKANKELPIYSVKTEEKKVALTMNSAWEADDMEKILSTLKKSNVKITFFVVGDFVLKYPEVIKKISNEGHEIRESFRHTCTC